MSWDDLLKEYKAYLQSLQEEARARLFWEAQRAYDLFPGLLHPVASTILRYFFAQADFSRQHPTVFFSYPRLEKATGWRRGQIQTGIYELLTRKVITYSSGRYMKQGALKRRQEYFNSTQPTRSYYEMNAYSLAPAVELGLFLSFMRQVLKEHMETSEIEEMFREIAIAHKREIEEKAKAFPLSPKRLIELYGSIPSLLEFMLESLRDLPIGKSDRGDLHIGKSDLLIGKSDRGDLHIGKSDLHNKVKAKLSPETPSQSKENQYKNTHTQAPAEKNLLPDAQPPQYEKPPRPADQLPDIVREALLDHFRKQGTAKSPHAVLRSLSEAEIRELAREILSEELRYNYELQKEVERIVEQLPEATDVELLEYVLLSEEGRLKWLESRGIDLSPEPKPEPFSREQVEETLKELIAKFEGDLERTKKTLVKIYGRDEEGKKKLREIWQDLKKSGKLYVDKERNYIEWREA